MKKAIYVFDFDDVLVDFSHLLYKNIRENWRIYSKYFIDLGSLSIKEIQSRRFYYENEWLIRPEFINMKSEQYSALSIEIWNLFIKTFFNKEDIYDESEPTKFAKDTILNPLFIDSSNVGEVIILSRNVTKHQEESKKRFIERFFSHPKIKYINVSGKKSKGEVMLENGIGFDVFIDDEIPNIRNVVENTKDLKKKEFILPRYGYNNPFPKELKFIIEEKGGTVTYYEPFES